jgi:RHS repeat-associated protein
MTSVGRIAVYATLALGAFWPDGALSQTSLTRTSSFCYDMNIPGANCTNSHNTGLLNQEVVEPNTQSLRLETDYLYDSFGNKTQVTVSGGDIATRSSSTSYAPSNGSANGQFPTSTTNALSQTETWQYNLVFGKPTSHTGPNGITTTWQYDTFGRKILEARADRTQTAFSYGYCNSSNCPAGDAYYVLTTPQTASGAQNGPMLSIHYDMLDRETNRYTQGFDGSWIQVFTRYDGLGRVSQKTRPFFQNGGTAQWTTYTYDVLARVTTESLPDGHTIQHAFHGLVTTDTNQNSQTRTVTKNSQGQVASVTDALGNVTTFYYDPFGNLLQTVDTTGKNVVVITYDLRGRKTASSDPDLGPWSYSYNTLSQLVGQTDAKSQTSQFTYDLLGRLTQRVEADMTATWTYDGLNGIPAAPSIGKLVSASASGPAANGNNGFTRSLTYDSVGRPSAVATTIAGTPTPYVAQASYDANGRLSQVLYPSQFAVNYGYTSLGYVQQLTDASTGQVYWTANQRDAELHLIQDTAGNGIVTARGFDAPTGRLLSIVAGSSNTVLNFSYTYDGVGNVLTRADGNNNISEGFGYDTLNRLTSSSLTATGDSVSKFFSYDSLGNLLMKSDVGNYAYPEAGLSRPHGVLSIDGDEITATFAYDPNGNQITAAGTNFSRSVIYASYNKPSCIQQGASSIGFYDDVDHQRFQLNTYGSSSCVAPTATTRYFDAFGVHAEVVLTSGGAVSQWNDYLMVGGSMVGVRFLQGSTVTLRYFHQDHLGSIAVITDQNGAVVERDAYDPWGKRRFWNNGADDPTGSGIPPSQTIRGFTGQEMLASVGLVHLNGRVYDPYIGRMLSADPVVGDPLSGQSWNRYSYVYNNPLAYTDPTGYCAVCIQTVQPPPRLNWLARHSIVGDIFKIAVSAVCVAAGPGCAPFAPLFAFAGSAVVAGLSGGNFTDAMRAGTFAFVQAGALEVIGAYTGHTPAFGTMPYYENVIGHALVGCLMATASGSTCGSGAAAGAVPAFAGPLINDQSFSIRSLVANSTLGGLASVAGGGKFGNGAVTGAFGYLFNAVAPKELQPCDDVCQGMRNFEALRDNAIAPADDVFQFLFPVVGAVRAFFIRAAVGIAEIGAAGETAAGVDASAAKVGIQIPGTNTIRYPDMLTNTSLDEVKNVARLANTQQLQDYLLYAQENNLTFNVWVRPSTVLTPTVKDLVSSGQINLRYIPGTQ